MMDNRTFELAEKVCKELGFSKPELDDGILYFDGFSVEPIEEEHQSIGRTITRTEYAACELVIIHGGYWELPDQDFREFARCGSVIHAIAECKIHEERCRVYNMLEYFEYSQLEEGIDS